MQFSFWQLTINNTKQQCRIIWQNASTFILFAKKSASWFREWFKLLNPSLEHFELTPKIFSLIINPNIAKTSSVPYYRQKWTKKAKRKSTETPLDIYKQTSWNSNPKLTTYSIIGWMNDSVFDDGRCCLISEGGLRVFFFFAIMFSCVPSSFFFLFV